MDNDDNNNDNDDGSTLYTANTEAKTMMVVKIMN